MQLRFPWWFDPEYDPPVGLSLSPFASNDSFMVAHHLAIPKSSGRVANKSSRCGGNHRRSKKFGKNKTNDVFAPPLSVDQPKPKTKKFVKPRPPKTMPYSVGGYGLSKADKMKLRYRFSKSSKHATRAGSYAALKVDTHRGNSARPGHVVQPC